MQLRQTKACGPGWGRHLCSVVQAFKIQGNAVIAMKCKGNEILWRVLTDLRIRYFVLLTPACVSGGPTDRLVCQSRKWRTQFLSCHFLGFEILICLFLRQSCTFWNNDNFHLIYICWCDGWVSSWWLMNGQNQFYYWVILTHKSLCCLAWHAGASLYSCVSAGSELMDGTQSLCSHSEAAARAFSCHCRILYFFFLVVPVVVELWYDKRGFLHTPWTNITIWAPCCIGIARNPTNLCKITWRGKNSTQQISEKGNWILSKLKCIL